MTKVSMVNYIAEMNIDTIQLEHIQAHTISNTGHFQKNKYFQTRNKSSLSYFAVVF